MLLALVYAGTGFPSSSSKLILNCALTELTSGGVEAEVDGYPVGVAGVAVGVVLETPATASDDELLRRDVVAVAEPLDRGVAIYLQVMRAGDGGSPDNGRRGVRRLLAAAG